MKLTDFDVMRSKIALKGRGVSEPTNAQIAMEFIRQTRDSLLFQSDWRGNSDVTMSTEWKTYRQELRDITTHEKFPDTFDVESDFPTKPS